jgi:hypothetical protein
MRKVTDRPAFDDYLALRDSSRDHEDACQLKAFDNEIGGHQHRAFLHHR